MKQRITCFLSVLLSCSLLSGCGTGSGQLLATEESTEESYVQQEIKIIPNNVFQLGESFPYFPHQADGYFLVTVNSAKIIQDASECPPVEAFYGDMLTAYPDGVYTIYRYDDWFTEGGAYDHGARLLKVEVSVTNVDAVGWSFNEQQDETSGTFKESDIFAVNILMAADMSVVKGPTQDQYYEGSSAIYRSVNQSVFQNNDPTTEGIEQYAVRLPPGETITFTEIFTIGGDERGGTEDLSMQWLSVHGQSYVKTGIFIDTKLGEDEA